MDTYQIKKQVNQSTVELVKVLEKLKKDGVKVSVSVSTKYDISNTDSLVPSISIEI